MDTAANETHAGIVAVSTFCAIGCGGTEAIPGDTSVPLGLYAHDRCQELDALCAFENDQTGHR